MDLLLIKVGAPGCRPGEVEDPEISVEDEEHDDVPPDLHSARTAGVPSTLFLLTNSTSFPVLYRLFKLIRSQTLTIWRCDLGSIPAGCKNIEMKGNSKALRGICGNWRDGGGLYLTA